jgi:hypothetical protein
LFFPGATLQYEDEDHDKVILSSDSDLIAAVDHARQIGWKVMSFPKQRCTFVSCQRCSSTLLFAEPKVALGLRRCWPPEERRWFFRLRVRWQGRMGFCVQCCRGWGGSGRWARRDGILETVRVSLEASTAGSTLLIVFVIQMQLRRNEQNGCVSNSCEREKEDFNNTTVKAVNGRLHTCTRNWSSFFLVGSESQ